MRKSLLVDVDRCLGCRTCQLACAVSHSKAQDLLGAISEGQKPRLDVLASGEAAIPLQCRQCEDAPCVAICPTGALTRPDEDGPVVTNDERCIGCKSCMLVCPFGVISVGPKGRAIIKCDLCISRLEAGEEPACVAACPTCALKYGDLEEMTAELRRQAAEQARRAHEAGAKLQLVASDEE